MNIYRTCIVCNSLRGILWKYGSKCFQYKPTGLKCSGDPGLNIKMINNDRMLIQNSAGMVTALSTVDILSREKESQSSLHHRNTALDVLPLVPSLI